MKDGQNVYLGNPIGLSYISLMTRRSITTSTTVTLGDVRRTSRREPLCLPGHGNNKLS
jgi:hypothetical protein